MAADDEKKRKLRKRSCSLDGSLACLHQHKLAPVCIGASSAEEGLGTGTQRRHDRQVLRGGSRPRCSWHTAVPARVAAALGPSLGRSLQPDFAAGSVRDEASWAGRSIAPSLLATSPSHTNAGRGAGAPPPTYFWSNCSFLATAAWTGAA